MIRSGAMRLSRPEAHDVLDRWARGYDADGGYWTDILRLSDHDHSGGINGGDLPGYALVDHTHPSSTTGRWRFSTSTAVADPGPGWFSADTGDVTTATTLVLSRTTDEGTEGPAASGIMEAGDSIYVQDQDDATRYARYSVTAAPTAFPAYFTVPVAVTAAGTLIMNNQISSVTFVLAGSAGGGGGTELVVHGHTGPTTGGIIDYLRTQWGTDHLAAADPHPGYLTAAEGNGLYLPLSHAPGTDPHPQYLTQTEGDARYPLLTAPDPYPQYATDADLAAHAAAADPHPGYLTQAEGDGRYSLTGHLHTGTYATPADVSTAVGTHAAAADPHPVYATDADLTGYAPVGHTHPATDVTITGDNGMGVTESPANTFALATRVSADSGNALVLRTTGLYVSPAATDESVLARLTALETSVAALKPHTHALGTWGGDTLAPTGGIP